MATSSPMTISQAADLIDLSIQRIALKHTDLETDNFRKFYNVEKTNDYYDKDSSLSGFGEAGRLAEGAVIASESPVQGFDKTYTQAFQGKMVQFTMQEWKFGIDMRKLQAVVQDLRGSLARKRERLLTEYLEQSMAATTSYTVSDTNGNYTKSVVGGDGVALINSAHTREDGGSSWSNVISDGTTSNMDFAADGLRAAHRTASLIRDPKGNLMDVNLDTIIVRKGSPIAFDAMEINGALKKNVKPTSADRDGAPFGAFNVIELPYLSTSSEAYWWMFDSSRQSFNMGPQYRESQDITLDKPEVDYKTKTIMVSSTMAFDYGHNDARNWVGSNGTNV